MCVNQLFLNMKSCRPGCFSVELPLKRAGSCGQGNTGFPQHWVKDQVEIRTTGQLRKTPLLEHIYSVAVSGTQDLRDGIEMGLHRLTRGACVPIKYRFRKGLVLFP